MKDVDRPPKNPKRFIIESSQEVFRMDISSSESPGAAQEPNAPPAPHSSVSEPPPGDSAASREQPPPASNVATPTPSNRGYSSTAAVSQLGCGGTRYTTRRCRATVPSSPPAAAPPIDDDDDDFLPSRTRLPPPMQLATKRSSPRLNKQREPAPPLRGCRKKQTIASRGTKRRVRFQVRLPVAT